MEQMLKQILDGQQQIITKIDKLDTEVSGIKVDMTGMKLNMAIMKADMTAMNSAMATKTQQDENTQVIKAILHSIETANAELNGLKLTTLNKDALVHLATKEDVAETNDHLMALNERLFHQEAAISHLKAVK